MKDTGPYQQWKLEEGEPAEVEETAIEGEGARVEDTPVVDLQLI